MKTLVPIYGSIPNMKALEYALYLLKLIIPHANDSRTTNSELVMITVLPHFHIPLGFEKPMKSIKTGNAISLSEYLAEMNEMLKTECG